MKTSTGEMPFLDHLEELRVRILRSLGALVVGIGLGFWLVQRFRLVALLKTPIAPYLPDGKLVVLSPTDPVMIVLKLSFIVGLVLVAPVLIWQVWAFLTPALYEKEKKTLVPALGVGLVLFLLGVAGAWLFIVPRALAVLLSFQAESFATMITYEKYFGFVLQIVLAMGISAELPLLLIILTALGVVTPTKLGRFRRVAVVLSCVAGAFLSPGADIFSMIFMTVPLLLLYEVGVAGSIVVHRRRLRRAATAGLIVLLVGGLVSGEAAAQATQPGQLPPQRQDTTRAPRRLDVASARRMGLPTAPTKTFPSPDSVMAALFDREGFFRTRYMADTATISGITRRLRLVGNAVTERGTTILEAESISYLEATCDLLAEGDPRLFDQGMILVGGGIRYDTCVERGIVGDALTSFSEVGSDWFLRGNLGVDSSSNRIFAASSEITSCDLPVAHYHFQAKEIKWVSSSLIVARPAVLYIRDVPVAWLPFIFQETKPGRRSGILVPQFGFNDIVRPNTGYSRQITDFGYYFAISDYLDAAVRADWYASRYFRWSARSQYRFRDRFLEGSAEVSRQHESGGAVSTSLRWGHRQSFGLTTTLSVNVNFSTNTSVVANNAVDPFLSTQQLASDMNLTKRFRWGTLSLGGRRRQTLGDDQVSQQFPALALTPKPLAISQWATWSPTVRFSNDVASQAKKFLAIPRPAGGVDSVEVTPRTRNSVFNLDTPLRFGSFNWRNTVSIRDAEATSSTTITTKVANDATPDPTDSISVTRLVAGTFSTTLNWDTGINLPLFARRTWKITPTIGITNTTSGEFAIRNERTGGAWVTQGKRFTFGLSAAPSLFAFLPGIGPIERIRHTISPLITWEYAPAATVPEEYANALAANNGTVPQLESPARQRISISLSQNFEAKEKRAAGDTSSTTQQRKYRLLGINTSGLSYDFEQAKEEGRTGWQDPTITNTIQSDLLPGFNLSVSHSLWDGLVGTDEAKFDPFLQSVNTSFSVSGSTLRSIGRLLGLSSAPAEPERDRAAQGSRGAPSSYINDPRNQMQQRTLMATNQLTGARRPFNMNINFSMNRLRPISGSEDGPVTKSNIGFNTSFSPTPFWGVSWTTQYNVTEGAFEAHIIRLERDLHDWRAGFNFVKNPNGNFAFYFSVHLVDLPDLKVDYNQTSISR
jgi:Tat protein translocase TatC